MFKSKMEANYETEMPHRMERVEKHSKITALVRARGEIDLALDCVRKL